MPTLPVTRRLDDPHSSPVLAEARQLAWTRGVAAEPILVAGEAPSTIVGLAQDLGAELLVIGSQRRLAPAVLVARTRHWVQTHARSRFSKSRWTGRRPRDPRPGQSS